jgi:hypothetical protein
MLNEPYVIIMLQKYQKKKKKKKKSSSSEEKRRFAIHGKSNEEKKHKHKPPQSFAILDDMNGHKWRHQIVRVGQVAERLTHRKQLGWHLLLRVVFILLLEIYNV